MTKYVYTLIIACWACTASAQDSWQLQQCIDTALKNSLQLKSNQLDVAKTQAAIGQAYSNLLPTLSAGGSYQYYTKVPSQLVPAQYFGGSPGEYAAVSLTSPQSKSVSIDASQQLFNASSLIALKAAKAVQQQNELTILSSKEDLVYNVSASYYNIEVIRMQIQLQEISLANTEALLKSTTDQFKAGLATQTDLDRLSVSRDNSQSSLDNSRISLQKEYNLLKLLMNVPLERPLNIVLESDPGRATPSANADTDPVDPTQKTNYRQVLESKHIADLELANIKAGYYPTLTLSGNLGYSGYYSNANPLKYLNDRWYPSSYVQLKLNIPIFDGFSKKYQIRQKRLEMDKYDVQAEQTKQQNVKDAANAYEDLKYNLNALATQRRNLDLAQRVLADLRTQYQSGIAKVTDVINSQTELNTAQSNYLTAVIKIKQSTLDLKKAQGTLLKP